MGRITRSFWRPWRRNLPTSNSELPIERLTESLYAVHAGRTATSNFPSNDHISCGHGWGYSNSVTLGEAAPGTAAKPAREYFYYGSGITRTIIKRELTYTGAAVTKVHFTISEDNGQTWTDFTDEFGNHMMNITYTGADIASITWTKV